MYAVIRTGSKQYRVEPGQELLVEKLDVEAGQAHVISDVLLYSDGSDVSIGKPNLPMSVHCLCVGEEKGPKLRTIKYRRRKNYKRAYGHRQTYTRLVVQKIETKGANA